MSTELDLPLSGWPIFYKNGLPYIYEDTSLFYQKNGERIVEPPSHSSLALYLLDLLTFLYQKQVCSIKLNLLLQAKILADENAAVEERRFLHIAITPDLVFIKRVQATDSTSYTLDNYNPPPNVVLEIASPHTYTEDIGRKWQVYAEAIQAHEYYVYDPHEKRLWEGPRLKAWWLTEGHYIESGCDERGWVWSEELESWLVENGANLWLYDYKGNRHLTPTEQEIFKAEQVLAQQEEFKAEQERFKAEVEKFRAEQARFKAEVEKFRAEQASVQQ
ncbi:MAG: Uma2 family endonuclease [Chloroflexota bacterium]